MQGVLEIETFSRLYTSMLTDELHSLREHCNSPACYMPDEFGGACQVSKSVCVTLENTGRMDCGSLCDTIQSKIR